VLKTPNPSAFEYIPEEFTPTQELQRKPDVVASEPEESFDESPFSMASFVNDL
jgi:hypothetical protein